MSVKEVYGDTQIPAAVRGEYPCEGCPDVNIDGERCVNEDRCEAWTIYTGLE